VIQVLASLSGRQVGSGKDPGKKTSLTTDGISDERSAGFQLRVGSYAGRLRLQRN